MTKKKLESFKVVDKHAPRVKPSHGGGAEAGQAEAGDAAETPTLGFARIEEILDHEQPGDVQKSLLALIDTLDGYMADARSQKERAPAKRAKMAVERTIDLLAYLFDTKEAMLGAITGAQPRKDGSKPAGKPTTTKRSK